MSEERVLVTGASGFLATHIVQQLLQKGYRVRGTVRSLQNTQRVQPLRDLSTDSRHSLELVEADLTQADSWKDAVKDCKYVMHTASPFPVENPRDPDDVIKPAVDGVLAVLEACRGARTVKRVVLTGAAGSMNNGMTGEGNFTEENWTTPDAAPSPYFKSKVLAEKSAWAFMETLSEEEKFELAVVNPGYIAGPVLCGSYAASFEIPKRMLQHEMPMLPRLFLGVVDVRDAAAAHVRAMLVPEAAGQRHILVGHHLWVRDMARILNSHFRSLGYKVPMTEAPYFLIKLAALVDKSVEMVLPGWGKVSHLSNRRMTEVLGVKPRDVTETIVDMCHSMIQRGFIFKTHKYRQKYG